jgi:hypothetical protein
VGKLISEDQWTIRISEVLDFMHLSVFHLKIFLEYFAYFYWRSWRQVICFHLLLYYFRAGHAITRLYHLLDCIDNGIHFCILLLLLLNKIFQIIDIFGSFWYEIWNLCCFNSIFTRNLTIIYFIDFCFSYNFLTLVIIYLRKLPLFVFTTWCIFDFKFMRLWFIRWIFNGQSRSI